MLHTHANRILSKCQLVQGGTHCKGLRGDEGGVRLQVIHFSSLVSENFLENFEEVSEKQSSPSRHMEFFDCINEMLSPAFAPWSSSTQRAWWWPARSPFTSFSASPSLFIISCTHTPCQVGDLPSGLGAREAKRLLRTHGIGDNFLKFLK